MINLRRQCPYCFGNTNIKIIPLITHKFQCDMCGQIFGIKYDLSILKVYIPFIACFFAVSILLSQPIKIISQLLLSVVFTIIGVYFAKPKKMK